MKRSLAFSRLILAGSLAAFSALGIASPVPAALQISGTISLDTANAQNPTGSASQSGELAHISGGVTSTSAFATVPAVQPLLSGDLTQTGDGIGAHLLMSGSYSSPNPSTGPFLYDYLFADYAVNLSNSSASATYHLRFRADIADTGSVSGADAASYAQVEVLDANANLIYFYDRQFDTIPSGNLLDASPQDWFEIALLPNSSESFSALLTMQGGVFAEGAYSNDFSAFLILESIRCTGEGCAAGQDLPLPGTLPLLAVALLALTLTRRR